MRELLRVAGVAACLLVAGCMESAPAVDSGPVSAPAVSVTAPVTAPVTVEEDSPEFNCLTMGNRVCGQPFVPFWGDVVDASGVNHSPGCLVSYGDTSTMVCPDGFVDQS